MILGSLSDGVLGKNRLKRLDKRYGRKLFPTPPTVESVKSNQFSVERVAKVKGPAMLTHAERRKVLDDCNRLAAHAWCFVERF